jgi:hypothetical protein
MKKFWVLIGMALVFSVLLFPVRSAHAAVVQGGGDEVILGENYHLEDGKSVDHGLVLVGCNAVIGKEAQVNGDLTVAGGNLDIQEGARINGNVVVVRGTVDATGATVNGDVGGAGSVIRLSWGTEVNGTVYLGPGSTLEGSDYKAKDVLKTSRLPFGFDKKYRFSWGGFPLAGVPATSNGAVLVGLILGLYKFLLAMFLVLLLGVALVAVWPHEVGLMGGVALSEIVTSFAVGFVVILLGFPVGVVLVILIITLPFGLLLLLLLLAAMAVGWVAVALKTGEKLLIGFKVDDPTPLLSVVVGGAVLILLGKVPCVGWAITLVAVTLGTGAVVLTRFGTKEYGRSRFPTVQRAIPEAVTAENAAIPPEAGGEETGGQPG